MNDELEDGQEKKSSHTDDADLQFDRVEAAVVVGPGAAPALQCTACRRPLPDTYFSINGRVFCETCCRAIQGELTGKVGFRKLARAGLRGFGAAAIGSLLYYGVRAVTGYELGLVAIVVGYLVGNTVRKAAGGRGGWQLQALAMFLTYTAIVSTYVPVIYQTMISMAEKRAQPAAGTKSDGDGKPSTVGQETSKDTAKAEPAVAEKPPSFKRNHPILRLIIFLPLQFLLVFGIAMVMPILAGAQNIIGLFIIGIALYQAWKINKKIPLTIEGPLRVGGGASGNLSAAL